MRLDKTEVEDNIFIAGWYDMDDAVARDGELYVAIDETCFLEGEADKVMKANGALPFFDYSGEYDPDGWYDMYLLCGEDSVKALVFRPQETKQELEEEYEIPTDPVTRAAMFDRIESLFGAERWQKIFGRG